MTSRRRFLKFGFAGTLLLAAAGGARAVYRAADGTEVLQVLGADERNLLAAIVPAILAGTLASAANLAPAISSVDRAIAGLPPHLQREVGQLLALLVSWPGRRLLAGVSAPWASASREEVSAFLERWRVSRWPLLQQGYQALHELGLAAWYARPDSWAAISYPGPPDIR